jgi:hypothetical protein
MYKKILNLCKRIIIIVTNSSSNYCLSLLIWLNTVTGEVELTPRLFSFTLASTTKAD